MTNAVYPDAIVLACWPAEDPLLRQLETGTAMMPMGDKPMLQRVLEKLVDLGCRRIAVVHGDQPQEAEALLGDGERWGCGVSHHYATEGTRPLALLARLAPGEDRNCVLAPADTLALTSFDANQASVACSLESGQLRWTGWAVLPCKAIRWLAETAQNGRDLGDRVMTGLDLSKHRLLMTTTISTASVAATLDSLPRLFNHSLGPRRSVAEGIGRRAQSEGVWVGNGSRVHPSARLRAPVFIGQNVLVAENADIGPNAAIGDGCIIDSGSRIEDSVLLSNTYVGQNLEVAGAMLAGSQFVNSRLGVALQISDPEFLRDVNRGDSGSPRVAVAQRALAALLWLALAPLAAVRRLRSGGRTGTSASIGIPAPAAGAWRLSGVGFAMTHEQIYAAEQGAWTRHFLATFLPGLADAVAGKVALVGLQPRTEREITALPFYWQRLYRSACAGLVGEALLLGPDGAAPEMRHAGDALCAGPVPLARVLRVLGRYAARVITEILGPKTMYAGTSGKTAPQSTV